MIFGRRRHGFVREENVPPGQPLGLVERFDALELEDVMAFIGNKRFDRVFPRSFPPSD